MPNALCKNKNKNLIHSRTQNSVKGLRWSFFQPSVIFTKSSILGIFFSKVRLNYATTHHHSPPSPSPTITQNRSTTTYPRPKKSNHHPPSPQIHPPHSWPPSKIYHHPLLPKKFHRHPLIPTPNQNLSC